MPISMQDLKHMARTGHIAHIKKSQNAEGVWFSQGMTRPYTSELTTQRILGIVEGRKHRRDQNKTQKDEEKRRHSLKKASGGIQKDYHSVQKKLKSTYKRASNPFLNMDSLLVGGATYYAFMDRPDVWMKVAGNIAVHGGVEIVTEST